MADGIISEHLDFWKQDPLLVDQKICFRPSKLNWFVYKDYPYSSLRSDLLPRNVYLARQQHQEDIRRLHLISQALSNQEEITIYLLTQPSYRQFHLPILLEYQSTPTDYPLVIPAKQSFLFVDTYLCLLPGQLDLVEGKYVYTSRDLVESLQTLDDKKNYDIGSYYLDLSGQESLEELQDKFVNFLRNRVKRQLQEDPTDQAIKIYQLTDEEVFPLEKIITEGDSCQLQYFVKEFPLIYTNYHQEVTLFVNQADVIMIPGDQIKKCGNPKRNFLISPLLASQTRTDKYDFPIMVEIRALHINYAYRIIDDPPVYEDYLGTPAWIISPVELYRSNRVIHAKISYPPHYLLNYFELSTQPDH